MRKILRSNYFLIIIYILLALLVFDKLSHTFFQQDEWAIFGNYLYWEKAHLNWFDRLFMYEQDTHIIPLSNFFSYLQFAFFRINFAPYALVSIGIHTINTLAVYCLTFLLTKQKKISFVAGIIFLTNSITHQATTWIATTVGTEGSTFFILLSIILFVFYLQKNKLFLALISAIFLCVSLLFKETGIFVFMFFPILWLLYAKNKNYKVFIKDFSPFFLLGISYVVFRIYFLLFGYVSTSAPEIISQPGLMTYLYRAITIPLKFIAQSFIPMSYIILFAGSVILLGYPYFVHGKIPDIQVVQTIGSDIVSYTIAIIILLTCLMIIKYLKRKKEEGSKLIILCLSFIFLSSLPFILIPGKAGYFSLVDGRHLYLTSIFSSILLSIIIFALSDYLGKKRIAFLVSIFIVLAIIAFNARQIRSDLWKQIADANVRKSILEKIVNTYPILPKKVIIYAESDSSYYGLPIDEKILPFFSGFGQTLLVWYNEHGESFPACFFQAKYLYDITGEGYKECDGRGFGYFRKLSSLKKAISQFRIDPKAIIAFRYISNENKLEDIGIEIKGELALWK